jgi:hypothetical protein
MKNPYLSNLNFHELLHYGKEPKATAIFSKPIECAGYCILCEEAGLLQETGYHLYLMSHGCDTSVYEAIIGPLPGSPDTRSKAVMFLLENPGGEYGNGNPVEFKGYRKEPPVNGYYFGPEITFWPSNFSEFDGNYYSPYFAYLMKKHFLKNVYITNAVKCKEKKDPDVPENNWRVAKSKVYKNCIDNYLHREVDIFVPEIVFCFGGRAEECFKRYLIERKKKVRYTKLYHPAYIASRFQTSGKSRQELIDENDRLIKEALQF